MEHGGIQLLDKSNGLQILQTAIDVAPVLPITLLEIKAQHAGYGIHPHSVDVIVLIPEEGVGDQEREHLRLAEVK
ncbi:hypothetical protein D3C76_1730520 [compost metagenome]